MSEDTKSPKTNVPRKSRAGALANGTNELFGLPTAKEHAILTGAAADSTDPPENLKNVPRILRVAFLIDAGDNTIHARLVADIEALCPRLPLTAAFAANPDPGTALALAVELDVRAAAEDQPELRQIADAIRLLCCSTPPNRWTTVALHLHCSTRLSGCLRRLICSSPPTSKAFVLAGRCFPC
jgi:hypothetical protein